MKHLSLLFTLLISVTQLSAMSEFDELAHRITDNIRTDRPVTPEFLESWYDHGDRPHIQSVCDAFKLPDDSEQRLREVRELEDLLVEHKGSVEQTRFHKLMEQLSPKKREPITLLLMNYMIGIPSAD